MGEAESMVIDMRVSKSDNESQDEDERDRDGDRKDACAA